MDAMNDGGSIYPDSVNKYAYDAIVDGDKVTIRLAEARHEQGPGGLTLRDYFAGQALPMALTAILGARGATLESACEASGLGKDATPAQLAASVAYSYADAMIIARAALEPRKP